MKKFAVLLIPLMLLAACGEAPNGDTDDAATADTAQPVVTDSTSDKTVSKSSLTIKDPAADATTNKNTATVAAATPPAPLIVNIESGNFYFKPSKITAKVGQAVTVNIANSGFHDFKIDALDVDLDLHNTPSGKITFTPTKAGTYEFYCSVGSHKAQGMKGTLVVTE